VPLAFLPEHVWQIGAGAMAVLLAGDGVYLAWSAPTRDVALRTRTRWVGCVAVLFAIGLATAAVFVNAEPPRGLRSGHWGGTTGVAMLIVWLGLLIVAALAGHRALRGRGRSR
jgi:hypothetical protein